MFARLILAFLTASALIACQPSQRPEESASNLATSPEVATNSDSNLKRRAATAALPKIAGDPDSDPEKVKALLDAGADPRQVSENALGELIPLLYYVASQGSEEALRLVLDAGASWDQLSQAQLNQALLSATCDRSPYAVEELLSAGADPNYENHLGETPLGLLQSEFCLARGYTQKRLMLIEAGAAQ